MTMYQCILSTKMTKRLLSPSTVMSESWKKSKNQTKIFAMQTFLQNLSINTPYLSTLPKVTFCPTNVNGCTMWCKTLRSLDLVLLILPVTLL